MVNVDVRRYVQHGTNVDEVELRDDILRVEERDSQIYHADWDLCEDPAYQRSLKSVVSVPHKQTGELVHVDLLVDSPDEIVMKCGIPEHERASAVSVYRTILLDRMRFWDKGTVPDSIPLLQKKVPA